MRLLLSLSFLLFFVALAKVQNSNQLIFSGIKIGIMKDEENQLVQKKAALEASIAKLKAKNSLLELIHGHDPNLSTKAEIVAVEVH